MKSKYFRWVFLALLVLIFYFDNLEKPVIIGSALSFSDGKYYFAAGTSPGALLESFLIIVSYLFFINSQPDAIGSSVRGIFRRFAAFWLDFLLVVAATAPVFGILPTVTEWLRTGVFAWNFERTESAPGDAFLAFGDLLPMLAAIAFYFAWPLMRRMPTPGTCIMGYQIIADDEQPLPLVTALKRTAFGFIAACSFWRAFGGERDPEQGKIWLDKKFATRAVKLT